VNIIAQKNVPQKWNPRVLVMSQHFYRSGSCENIKNLKTRCLYSEKKTRRKTNDLLKKGIIQKQPCVVCGKHDVIAHHEDYSRSNDVIWICEGHHKKYHDGKIGLFNNKLWWNPNRLLPRSMRNGNMPRKYQKLKSQFKKKRTVAPNQALEMDWAKPCRFLKGSI